MMTAEIEAQREDDWREALPDLKSLSGHSAYCEVCWEPFYRLWVAQEDHGGVCVLGHSAAHDCPQAMSAARLTADLKALAELDKQGGAQC